MHAHTARTGARFYVSENISIFSVLSENISILVARTGVRFPAYRVILFLPVRARGGAKFEFGQETSNPHYLQYTIYIYISFSFSLSDKLWAH